MGRYEELLEVRNKLLDEIEPKKGASSLLIASALYEISETLALFYDAVTEEMEEEDE